MFRLSRALPNSPSKRQQTLDDFFKKKTPPASTDTSLTEIILSKDLVDTKEERAFRRLLARKLQFRPKVAKQLNVNVKKLVVNKVDQLKRRSREAVRNSKRVSQFFFDNSRILPLKRGASRAAKGVLESNLRELYREYLQLHPFVSFSFFCKSRPKSIKTQLFSKFNQALCECCENLHLKIKCFSDAGIDKFGKNKEELLKLMLCPSEGKFYLLKCIMMECTDCGPQKLFENLENRDLEKVIHFQEWGMKQVQRGEMTVKRKALLIKTSTLMDMKKNLIDELGKIPLHLLRAKWQYSQFLEKKKYCSRGNYWLFLTSQKTTAAPAKTRHKVPTGITYR